MSNTAFYEFSQNNSGGYFDVDHLVCHCLFIEAKSADEANEIAESKGVYFNGTIFGGDCPCCGDRWYSVDDDDAITFPRKQGQWKGPSITYETIEEYAQHLADEYGWTTPDARIFYLDGTVKEIFKRDKGVS